MAGYTDIVPNTTTGANAATVLNKVGNDADISFKRVSAIADVASEIGLFVAGTIVFAENEKKYYRYSGSVWDEYEEIQEALVAREDWLQNGFVDITASTLTWTDETPDRTLSIQPTDTSFDYFCQGIRYTTTGDTVQISDTEGIHVIYYDDDTLTALSNPTVSNIASIIRGKAIASIVYWDKSEQEAIYVGEERHGCTMSPSTHSYLHFTEGLRYLSGLGLSSVTADDDGDVNASAQFAVDSGAVTDEDLRTVISQVTVGVGLPIYYMLGSGSEWQKYTNAGYSVRTFDGTDTTRLAWNELDGSTWKLTEVDNRDFVLCHVFATTEKDKPMIAIMGQNEYDNKGSARAGAETEVQSLILNDVLFPEIRPIATLIFETQDGYDNDVKARVVTTDEGDNYVDWRNEKISRSAVSTTDHSNLAGLSEDDHTQYVTVAGRTGESITVDGDIDATGYITSVKSGVYATLDASTTNTCASDTTWYTLSGTFTNSPIENFVFDTDHIKYTGTKTQYFVIHGDMAASSDNNNTTVSYAIKKNTTVFERGQASTFCKNLGQPYNLSGHSVIELETDDEIQIVVKSDIAGSEITTALMMVSISEFFD